MKFANPANDATQPNPKCPKCGKRNVRPSGDRNWFCGECRMEFDPTDDGEVGYGSPSRRLEREERNRKQWPRRRK